MRGRRLPTLVALVAPVLGASAAGPAFAGAREQCVLASERGQDLRDAGKLLAAREQFVACAQEACPALVRADCARWLAGVEDRIPAVVLRVRDREGRDLAAARVAVDGKPLAGAQDGRSLELDPGPHTVALEVEGFAPAVVQLVAREGERNRLVDVALEPAPSAAAPVGAAAIATAPSVPPRAPAASTEREASAPRPFPVAAAALGAAGIAGIGVFAALGLSARADVQTMRQTCRPWCSQEKVDAAQRKALWANVSLGAGIVAAGSAAWLWLRHPEAAPAPSPAALRWDFAPAPGGALCSVQGRF